MSSPQEIIDWLNSPLEYYEGGATHNLYAGHLLDREECNSVIEAIKTAYAEECASCQKIIEGVADVLHNQTTDRTAAQAYLNEKPIYGVVGDMEMRAAAKVLRSIATSLRVREIKLREGKL
jgi:hypothetical protein